MSRSTEGQRLAVQNTFQIRGYHPLWLAIPGDSLRYLQVAAPDHGSDPMTRPTTLMKRRLPPVPSACGMPLAEHAQYGRQLHEFGLIPVRSPLLRE